MGDIRKRFKSKQQQHEATIATWARDPPQTLYDIGVSNKTEAVTLKTIWPDLVCYGVEPQLAAFNEAKETFPGNLRRVGIASEPLMTLHCHDKNVLNASMIPLSEQHKAVHDETVQCITLDAYDHSCGYPNDIVLWMDIEGWELKALETGTELLQSGRVKWINLEERKNDAACEGTDWPSPSELKSYLKEFFYDQVCTYNRHSTHMDVLYAHRTVRLSRKSNPGMRAR